MTVKAKKTKEVHQGIYRFVIKQEIIDKLTKKADAACFKYRQEYIYEKMREWVVKQGKA